jgi:hypothetical protein
MINSLTDTFEFASTLEVTSRRSIVLELPQVEGVNLDGLLRLRVTHPDVRVVDPRDGQKVSQAGRIAAAFASGADAYVVDQGDLASDLELIDEISNGAPLFEPRSAAAERR